jgi:ABC-type glycerol-3-phosphate transport system substrate-binding protein
MILLDPGLLTKQSDKIIATPYSLFSERDFKDTFADQGNLFLSPEGVLAIPISIDPIVMYYNKDILNQKGIITPPLYWNDFITLAPKLSEVSQPSGTLVKSMVALGEYDNISHAKDILAMLMLQLGNPIVSTETKFADKVPYVVYKATFGQENSEGARVGESSLRFYTQFADPAKTTYSWNKSFSNSRDLFVSGKLAFYFGYASEYNAIRDKNPNISFDIARVPQVKDYPTKVTYGKMLGIAVLKSSRNQAAAFNTSQYLISPEYAPFLASTLGTAPARRDLLSVKQEDAYNGVVYPSAIIARGWLDPDSEKSDKIFRNMITAVVSGRDSVADAIETAVADLQDALPVAQ